MLYYIHGYQSSPDGNKGTLFREKLNAKAIKYRDCEPEDLIISDCLKRISEEISNDKDVVLIGSSLGGFLAALTAITHHLPEEQSERGSRREGWQELQDY